MIFYLLICISIIYEVPQVALTTVWKYTVRQKWLSWYLQAIWLSLVAKLFCLICFIIAKICDLIIFLYLFSVSANSLQIRAGSSSSQSGGQLYQVGDLIWNPGFTYSRMDHDVALIWLSTPLEFSDSIAPISLFFEGEEVDDGGLTVITGWGNLRVSTTIIL